MPFWLWIPNPDEEVEEYFGGADVVYGGGGGKDMYIPTVDCSGIGELLGEYLGRRLGDVGEIIDYKKGVNPVMSRMRKREISGVELPYPYNTGGDKILYVFYGDYRADRIRAINKEEFNYLAKAFRKEFEKSYLEYSVYDRSFFEEARERAIPRDIKRQINRELDRLLKGFIKRVPDKEIYQILNKYGIELAEVGGDVVREFWITGDEGQDVFDVLYRGERVNNVFELGWYRDVDGRWDITAYIS